MTLSSLSKEDRQLVLENRKKDVEAFDVEMWPDGNKPEYLSIAIENMGLHVRMFNILDSFGVETVGDIRLLERNDAVYARNIGPVALKGFDQKIEDFGIWFYDDFENKILIAQRLKNAAQLNFMIENPDLRMPSKRMIKDFPMPSSSKQAAFKENKAPPMGNEDDLLSILPQNEADIVQRASEIWKTRGLQFVITSLKK